MRHFFKKYRTALLVFAALIVWGVVFVFISPDAIVARVGVQNSYLVSFIVSLIAGFSVFTGTTAYATVIEFSRGGSDPLLLGCISGIGIFISDSIFYALAIRGRDSIQEAWPRFFKAVQRVSERVPTWAIYLGVYLFSAFGPIPNDVLLVALLVSGYRFRRFWPYLLGGDITFMLILSYLFKP